MMNTLTIKRISSVSVATPIVVSLFITTGINIDPVNLPKMLLLAVIAGYLLGLMVSIKFGILWQNKILTIFVLSFLLGLFLSTVFSENSFWQTFYGSYGRNTGFLTYISLLILLVSSTLIADKKYFALIIKGLFFSGLFNVVYGILQINDLDPIDWSNNFNAIIGTFGNPNFSSAFISVSLITYPFMIQNYKGLIPRTLFAISFILSLYGIYSTKSQQGYFLFIMGFLIILISFLIKSTKYKIYGFATLAISILSGTLAILGFLQKGPFASLLYQPSISLRGFYWQAGLSMFLEKPLFGNGLDAYGNLYQQFRSADSILPPGGINVYTNAAHNVLIDLAASGGILLLIPYLGMIVYTVILSLRVFRNLDFNLGFTSVFAIWLCLQLQSLVSINQVGLAVWIWSLNGALVGYSSLLLNNKNANTNNTKAKVRATSASAFVFGVVFCAAFLASVLPEQIKDMNFKSSMEGRSIEKVLKVVQSHPLNSYRMFKASQVFLQNKLYNEALQVTLKSLEFDSNDLNSWIMLISNPIASEEQKALAKRNLIRIDPRNPEWKKLKIQ